MSIMGREERPAAIGPSIIWRRFEKGGRLRVGQVIRFFDTDNAWRIKSFEDHAMLKVQEERIGGVPRILTILRCHVWEVQDNG